MIIPGFSSVGGRSIVNDPYSLEGTAIPWRVFYEQLLTSVCGRFVSLMEFLISSIKIKM